MEKGKSINSLMKHIRTEHKIDISGSNDKKHLLNMGYYHGYKATRFIKQTDNKQDFETFKEVKAMYEFDNAMKSLFYPLLTSIETILKNRLIDFLVSNDNPSLEHIYQHKLTSYKDYTKSSDIQKYHNKRLQLRTKMDETIAYNYKNKNVIINHYFHKEKPLPLWAYFEVISLGEFGNFISCIRRDVRKEFTSTINLHHSGFNEDGRILESLIFLISDLRNAVMHNSIIFDCRFKKSMPSKQVKEYFQNVLGINRIEFETITEYLILAIVLLKKLSIPKKDLRRTVKEFENLTENLYKNIPTPAFFQIVDTQNKNIIKSLNQYIDK
ncbi:Abi family protein [Aerococcus agrisoli]|uniref:Abi family protein n=1 Tax=Aerococcus agrisoli TaxID=2487350 RepID=A0A3N4GEW1_9LACT|nr:Abi family protein [Aerococcus agrisoli]RPA60428.1 Abi family protein [Aerococcus agrisoli]